MEVRQIKKAPIGAFLLGDNFANGFEYSGVPGETAHVFIKLAGFVGHSQLCFASIS